MKARPRAAPGVVADGYRRYVGCEEFRERERAVCRAVAVAFAPRLAAARGMRARWRVHWAMFLARQRALRALRPSMKSCFLRGAP